MSDSAKSSQQTERRLMCTRCDRDAIVLWTPIDGDQSLCNDCLEEVTA